MKDTSPTSTPTESAPAEQVLVLPGHLFFIETIDVPVDLDASELTDFIELSLESIAPFPIEQLNWGYLNSDDVSTVLIYAAHRDRLKNAGYTDLQSYAWVLPDFATLAGACFPDQTLVALESDNHLSLALFDAGSSIPRATLATPLTDTSAGEALQNLKASASNLPKTAYTLKIHTESVELNEQGLPTFKQGSVDDARSDLEYGSWTTLTQTESQLWQADVRSSAFKDSERSARRLGAVLLRITGWAAIFAVVLIGAELLLFACQGWLGTLDQQIESQRAAVLTIEEKQALMIKLEQVSQNELRPISMLEAANNSDRRNRNLWIEFDSIVIEGENHITIEGKASSINAIINYADSLKKSGKFEIIADPKYSTRLGKTTFTVTLGYAGIEPPAPAKAVETAESETATEESEI